MKHPDLAESHRLVAEICLASPSASTFLSLRSTSRRLFTDPHVTMLLKAQMISGILKLATRPAIDNRLFSTCRTAQQWQRPDKEMKYYNDPEWRRRWLDMTDAARLRRLQYDPEARDRKLAQSRAWYTQHGKGEYLRFKRLLEWCYRHDWIRHNLPWKTRRPKLYLTQVEHHCTGCGHTEKNGFKLWWRQINRSIDHKQLNPGLEDASNTEEYMCSSCMSKTGWENMSPRGFEDVTTIKEVRIRAKELGIDTNEGPEQGKHVSDQASQTQNTAHKPRT
jgi:hypothetical protein